MAGYHDVAQYFADASSRIRLLSCDLSISLAEALITQADGLMTISSTLAMASLLFGKKIVVVG